MLLSGLSRNDKILSFPAFFEAIMLDNTALAIYLRFDNKIE
uniref:Uncharacterized protein n=1 Tax=uncultured Desulfobacterium sp. TaxID=201089 RepID=E1YGM9_9BACT|nr:unknown protein [uncultured Desulfobacterium sp.]